MATQQAKVPTGHCRSCGTTGPLTDLELPVMGRRGAVIVAGSCQVCGTRATGFYGPLQLEELKPAGWSPVVVVSVAIGLQAGRRAAMEEANRRRNDEMLRLKEGEQLTHSVLGWRFGLSRTQVAKGLAEARQRRREKGHGNGS